MQIDRVYHCDWRRERNYKYCGNSILLDLPYVWAENNVYSFVLFFRHNDTLYQSAYE